MIPVRLELTNFLAYRNPAPLDFTGIHVAVLTGENGAGKSSLLDAITWALWGRARARTDAELVHQGQTEMRVEFTFALGDQLYRVIRAKRAGKSAGTVLDFQLQDEQGRWVGLGEATVPKTQEKIQRTLRLTYDTFVNSAYLMQGKADEFTGKRPTERKQVLADILGLQDWEGYEARAKESIRGIDTRLAGLDAVLTEIETDLGRRAEYERELAEAQTRVIEVNQRLREAEAGWAEIDKARQAMIALDRQTGDLTKRIQQADREIADLDADLKEAHALADIAAISAELEALRKSLTKLENLEAKKEKQVEEEKLLRDQLAELRAQNETTKAEAEKSKQRVEILEAATEPRCPTCGQPLDKAARTRLVRQLNTEVEEWREKYRANAAEVKPLAGKLERLENSLRESNQELREKPKLIKEAASLESTLSHSEKAVAKIEGLQERRKRWVASRKADQAERTKLDAEADKYKEILTDSAAKQRALDQLRQDDTLTKARLGAAQQKLAALDGLEKQRAAKRAERGQLAEERGLYEELREAFGKKGVPAMMIEAAVPEIEAAANALLTRMTGGRMNVRFNTQRETQGGEVRETLDLQISDELGTRAYEMYSGGEAFRVNFAVRVALSQLLARRAGTQLQTLIMDEGFGVLDAAGRERLVEAINAAQSDFQRILVVTHIDELKDAFPARIEVTKGPEGAQIMVV